MARDLIRHYMIGSERPLVQRRTVLFPNGTSRPHWGVLVRGVFHAFRTYDRALAAALDPECWVEGNWVPSRRHAFVVITFPTIKETCS